jgi:predicted ester cyclase
MINTQVIRRVLDRHYSVLNSHDVRAFARVVADDVVFHDDFFPDKVFHGSAEFSEVFAAIWRALPDLRFEILRGPFFAEGFPGCAVHGRITGTLANAIPEWGFTRIGGSVEFEYMAVYQVSDDRIASIRACLNPAVAARQLDSTEKPVKSGDLRGVRRES